MKKKLFPTILALTCAICCIFSLVACGGNNDGTPKPTALEKAYTNYRQTQNMTVTVTDSRTVKHGTDYSASVKIDYGHKAAYSKNLFTTTDNLGATHRIANECYYEIDSTKPAFTIYSKMSEEGATPSGWSVIDRSDLFDLPEATSDHEKFEIQLFTDFVNSYLPSHALSDTGWRVNKDDASHWSSLNQPVLLNKFTESANSYTANVYLCINIDGTTFVPYACAVTIKLDAQERFESVVLDFGTNGKITAAYTYGTATVTVPAEAKNAMT